MDIGTLLVCRPMSDDQRARVEAALPETEIIYREAMKASREDVERADVIFGNVQPEYISGSKKLRWVQLTSAGADRYAPCMPSGAVLTNATGAYGEPISEYMLGALLALRHKTCEYFDNQKKAEWRFCGRVREIPGSVCLVIGMGDIGGCFARKMKAMGAYVIGIRRTDLRRPDYCDELYLLEDLDKVLPRADVVALSLPNSPKTQGVLSAERIAAMKQGACVINVGRGSAIDQAALCAALNDGRLGGACLDVTTPEPLPADDPLWSAKNILITPHIAGGRMLGSASETAVQIFLENVSLYLADEPLGHAVDLESGYRKL